MKFRDFIGIIEAHGFRLVRQSGTSHRVYRAEVDGAVRQVVVACHSEGDDIKPGTLASMIRQSSLPKRLFR